MNIQEQQSPANDSGGEGATADRDQWYWVVLYYAAFFLFALIARGLPGFFNAPPPSEKNFSSLMLPLLTAWIGATIAIGIVFIVSGKRDAARITNHELLIFLGGGMAVDVVCNFAAMKWLGQAGVDALNGGANALAPLAMIATANLGVLAAAVGLGWLVARGLKKPSYLITAAVVGALTDIFSVYMGPSKLVLSSDVFPYVSYQWGIAGQGVMPCVGAGDFIFLCLFFAGARRFGLDDRKTFWAMTVAFGLGFLSVAFGPKAVPALPFMAALLLLVHWRELMTIQSSAVKNEGSD